MFNQQQIDQFCIIEDGKILKKHISYFDLEKNMIPSKIFQVISGDV